MDAHQRLRSVRWASAVAAASLLAVTTACSPTPAQTPPGPPSPKVEQTPGATASAGSTSSGSVHSGGVSADTYNAVLAALKSGDISVTSPSSLRMTYGTDKDHITVTDGGMSKAVGGGTPATITTVQMEYANGTWRVTSAQ